MSSPDQWLPGQLLQQAREHSGLSKIEAARRAGLSETWWRRLEDGFNIRNGKRIPISASPEALAKAARGVGLSVNQIFEAANITNAAPSHEEYYEEIAREAKRLPLPLQKEALAFIRGLNVASRWAEEL